MMRSWLFGAALGMFVAVATVLLWAASPSFAAASPARLLSSGAPLLVFGLAFALTPVAGGLARRLGALDHPGGRKIHERPTPLLGGLAIYTAFAISFLLSGWLGAVAPRGVFLAASLVFAAGLLEDLRGVSALGRLVVQALAVVVLIQWGVSLTFLPPSWWGVAGEWCLTFLWVVGITNAFNFLDGLDGLAAGSAAIHAFFLGAYAVTTGHLSLGFLSFTLMAAALGFLPHNYRPHRADPAKIFLGDSGSTFLGFLLASLAILGDWAEGSPKDLIAPVLIMAVPIFDMSLITVMRIREGRVRNALEWIVYTGRDHFHHRLLGLGIRKKEAVAIIYLINACLGISAFLLKGSSSMDAFLVLLQVSIIFGIVGYAMVVMSKRRVRSAAGEGPIETTLEEEVGSGRRAV